MDKKAYIQPIIEISRLGNSSSILAGSTPLSDFTGNGDIYVPDDEISGEGIDVEARAAEFFDDWE